MAKPKSMYQQTLGRPNLRGIAVEALYGDLERAKKSGNQGYERFITNELHALGQGDYTPKDEGMAPKGAK